MVSNKPHLVRVLPNIEGPSYQLRKKNINSNIKNNVVFEKGTPRVLKKIKGKVLSLITGGGANDNYWHWLYDVLPRLKICEKVIKTSLFVSKTSCRC